MFLKTGDKVRVIAGKDKGKEGTIKKVLVKENRVIVEGVNQIKKHQKPNNANPNGGIIDAEAPIQAHFHKGFPSLPGIPSATPKSSP